MPTALTAAVITVSDSSARRQRLDHSGPAVVRMLVAHGFTVVHTALVLDEIPAIEDALRTAAARVRLVVTTGGTGITLRDVTPEATQSVCERFLPGIAELMRQLGREDTIFASLSRGLCGLLGTSIILNLPGSPRGAVSSLRAALPVLPHALHLLEDAAAPHPDPHPAPAAEPAADSDDPPAGHAHQP